MNNEVDSVSNFQCRCSSKLYRKQNSQVLKPNVNCVTFAARPAGVQRKLRCTPCGEQAAKVGGYVVHPTRPGGAALICHASFSENYTPQKII